MSHVKYFSKSCILQRFLKYKPDHTTEIRSIFDNDKNPSFAVIDAVSGGKGWPTLQSLLDLESARDILFALLVPSDKQLEKLQTKDTWVNEASRLLKSSLGLEIRTRAKKWSFISEELWRFLLYSEFVFDLPGDLPEALINIPCSHETAKQLVYDLCDRLRNDQRTQAVYIERAEEIEIELDMLRICDTINDLGDRDTFPFEERTFLKLAMSALKDNENVKVKDIIHRHANCVWVGKGESQAQWGLLYTALNLIEACDDYERQLSDHSRSLDTLIDFYLISLRGADRYQREFEHAVSDYIDAQWLMADVIEKGRKCYRRLIEKVQVLFTKHLENSGWPPINRLSNADVFDRLVAPKLKESGRRIAYFLIDALRYELGVELEKQISEDCQVELHTSFSLFPSITLVGMASLLPEAGDKLRLVKENNSLIPMLGDTPVSNVNQRMDVLRKHYGGRFTEMRLNEFVSQKIELPSTIELLVLRSVDIDSQLGINPETTLGLIHDNLKRIRVAIYKLKTQGFHDVIIATDHGFFLNLHAGPGDVCTKPQGDWINVHNRSLLGNGISDNNNFVMPAENAGVKGDFSHYGGPRTLVPYSAGLRYFHGGASLQEAVVPVITARLEPQVQTEIKKAIITLSYKSGAKQIRTRLPVFDISLHVEDLFSLEEDFEILLEAQDTNSNIVGEAKSMEAINLATGTITLKPGKAIKVPIKMQKDFEGKFIIKALNPITLSCYAKLELETDYTV